MQSTTLSPLKPTPIRHILWLFLGTRLLIILATYISFILFPIPPHVYPQTGVNVTALLDAWSHWDALRYIQIAQYGYQNISDTAFFPLFPLLIKGVALLCGNHGYWLAALLVSNAALFGALYLLYQVATDALGEQVGNRTIVYLCLFPTAFFFFAGYNESLFLLFSCSSLFALHRQRWVIAGVSGLLAALTRSAGAMLILPYLYELWLTRDEAQPGAWKTLLELFPRALPIVLIPLGTLFYSIFCWRQFGDPLAFAAVQKIWHRSFTLPWTGIIDSFVQFFFIQTFGSFYEVHILIDLTATLGFIALAILGWRRLRLSYTLWIGLLLLYMLSSSAAGQPDSLVSNQRFVLEMFPGFITLAALGIKHPRVHQVLVVTFPFLQAILVALFVLNRWIV